MEVVRYTSPDNTGYVVTDINKEKGTVSLKLKYDRWTKFWGKCLAWFLWYKQEPGTHFKRFLPDGGVERWTSPLDGLYEEH
jgi:hypothetical protein